MEDFDYAYVVAAATNPSSVVRVSGVAVSRTVNTIGSLIGSDSALWPKLIFLSPMLNSFTTLMSFPLQGTIAHPLALQVARF